MIYRFDNQPEGVSRASWVMAQQMSHDYNRVQAHETGPMTRMDAGETEALALALEDARTRVYETEYPALKARQLISVSSETDTGADTYFFERENYVGKAKIIDDDAMAQDLPSVEVSSKKVVFGIVSLGVSYSYSLQDIRRAAFMGKALSTRKAMKARRAYEREFDRLAAFGEANSRIPTGMLNDTNIGTVTLANAGTFATKAAAGNPEQILEDLNKAVRAVFEDSKEVYDPSVCVLPSAQFKLVSQTRMAADTDRTVREAFIAANPGMRLESWSLLKGAGAASAARMLVGWSSPESAEITEAQAFEMLPPERRNLSFLVNCHGRSGGTAVMLPLAWRYMDGV